MFCEVRQSNAIDIYTTQLKNGNTIMGISVSYTFVPLEDHCSAVDDGQHGRDQHRQ